MKLGDSWNYIPPILVPSSAKCIAIQISVIAKLNGRKDFNLRGFICDIVCLSKELPVQRKYLKHKKVWKLFNINYVNFNDNQYWKWQSRRSSVFIVNCEHILNFVLAVDFKQINVYLVHVQKKNTFEDKIGHIICYVVVL